MTRSHHYFVFHNCGTRFLLRARRSERKKPRENAKRKAATNLVGGVRTERLLELERQELVLDAHRPVPDAEAAGLPAACNLGSATHPSVLPGSHS